MKAPHIACILVLPTAAVFGGCSAHIGSHQGETAFAPEGAEGAEALPTTPEELLALSRELGREGAPASDLIRAFEALLRLAETQGETVDLLIRQAQVIRYLVEPMDDRREVIRWARRGEDIAFRVRQLAPERVEGYYYVAMFLGFRAQQQRTVALVLLPRMEENGRRAVAIDETYDDAGPLRFMGLLLVEAPAWPHGIGDPEEGVELLRRAVELNDYPLNYFFLGKALLAIGEEAEACQVLNQAYEAPAEGRWARTREIYLPELRRLIQQNTCPQANSGFATAPASPPL